MLEVNERIRIPADELDWSYARAGGPGGQNVNKVASKAVLRWPMAASPSLPDEVKARVRSLFPSRVTTDGDLLIQSQEFRDQERNRQACIEKLIELLRAAARRPTPRRKTKPTFGSKMRRLEDKKRNSERKAGRKGGGDE